jgi:hypothetical protein
MILSITIGIGCVALILFFVFLKKKQDELESNFQRRFFGKNIKLLDKTALFVAQESDGYSHTRGIGYLVLTDEELYFERQLVHKVLEIPISSILGVGTTKRLAGQGMVNPMLKIEFNDNLGKEDSVALCVKDLLQWEKVIGSSLGK